MTVAALRPSGERRTSPYGRCGPTLPSSRPPRSNRVSVAPSRDLGRYVTIDPSREAPKNAWALGPLYRTLAATGSGWSEAPRGLLWHRYAIDDDGTILDARIVPPTSQNQARIERSVRGVVERYLAPDDEGLRHRCEQAVRAYDPCISCATHFLKVTVDRG